MNRIRRWLLRVAVFTAISALAIPSQPGASFDRRSANELQPIGSMVNRSAGCTPLHSTAGTIIQITPAQTDELSDIVGSAPPHSVIVLADGVYRIRRGLLFRQPNVTMRSRSAQEAVSSDPHLVVIDGSNEASGQDGRSGDHRVPELIGIAASGVTIADLTLQNAKDHLIHVTASGHDVRSTKIYNVRLIDPGEQAIKINTTPGSGAFTDEGEVACSRIELTDAGRARVERRFADGCYTGGIDAHQSRGWRLANNTIKGFWCGQGMSEHAIHLWTGSRDTVIEGNQILNSARGIGLGLGQYDGSVWRNYADGVCGGRRNLGHYGGVIRNNTVLANDARLAESRAGFDTGISLEAACGAAIVNNTVVSTVGVRSSAIEWRFSTTADAVVMNNLTNGPVMARNGAAGTVRTNVTDASLEWFRSVTGDGDLHLGRTIPSVVHGGTPIAPVTVDKDGHPRGARPDVGAYEYRPE